MKETITFLLNGERRSLRDVSPTRTLLDHLREEEGLRGTKEGCAEGDCGACTVTVSDVRDGRLQHRALNACILFLSALEGRSVTTVDALAEADGTLHPVQQAMVDTHGSQCGFCTPGIVMSLYTATLSGASLERRGAEDALAGNLCRCTGYGPILEAASRVDQMPPQPKPWDAALDALDGPRPGTRSGPNTTAKPHSPPQR